MTESHTQFSFGKSITQFALKNAVPMNLLFILLVVVGAIVIGRMPVDVYPDVSLDEATIEAEWEKAEQMTLEEAIELAFEELDSWSNDG